MKIRNASFLAIAALATLVGSANAASVFTITSGFSMTDIGRDTSDYGGDWDHLTYAGMTTGPITLLANTPQVATINHYVFATGVNSHSAHSNTAALADWTIDINGAAVTPQTVHQTYTIYIDYQDTIVVGQGPTLDYDLGAEGHLLVTPLGYSQYMGGSGDVKALMMLVPVPLPAAAGVGFGMLATFGSLFAARKHLRQRSRIA